MTREDPLPFYKRLKVIEKSGYSGILFCVSFVSIEIIYNLI